MNVRGQKLLYGLLILLFLIIIVGSVYYLLGGFREVRVESLGPVERTIVGKQFNTHYTSNEPRDFGIVCRGLIENGEMDGLMTVITYHSDTLQDDEVSQFIGIALNTDMAEFPDDYEVKEMTALKRYVAIMDMHVLVQPRPHKIEAMLRERASADGHTLEAFFFELRYPDNSLVVEGWVK